MMATASGSGEPVFRLRPANQAELGKAPGQCGKLEKGKGYSLRPAVLYPKSNIY